MKPQNQKSAKAWNLVLDTFVMSCTGCFDNSGMSVTPHAWHFDNLQWNLAPGAWVTQKPAEVLESALSTPDSLQNTFPIWINEEGAMVLPLGRHTIRKRIKLLSHNTATINCQIVLLIESKTIQRHFLNKSM